MTHSSKSARFITVPFCDRAVCDDVDWMFSLVLKSTGLVVVLDVVEPRLPPVPVYLNKI
jgi:hypothetical protein